jgi:ABC-type cobalt transport system substrate-binding protein
VLRRHTLAILCVILIPTLFIRQIVIDRDYAGSDAEATIKNILLRLVR